MRRLLSILLVLAFGLPTAAPALAQITTDSDANLPACCRRAGLHHCNMPSASGVVADHAPHFSARRDLCPCTPSTPIAVHAETLSTPAALVSFSLSATHPNSVAQTESRFRIARDRSRQKRGPPHLI